MGYVIGVWEVQSPKAMGGNDRYIERSLHLLLNSGIILNAKATIGTNELVAASTKLMCQICFSFSDATIPMRAE